MDAIILDTRPEDRGVCYLCKATLAEYVASLPATYRQYDVQREIVANVYLDRLVDTVLNRRHIPPIVLVAEANTFSLTPDQGTLALRSFKILDGLQRTYRLKAIRDTISFLEDRLADDAGIVRLSKYQLSKRFGSDLRSVNSSTDILLALIQAKNAHPDRPLTDCFANNHQWFEVWTGLNPEDEVRAMLVLNAGHKPVRLRHQLELLFLNLFPLLAAPADFTLVRERETNATSFSKNRHRGEFHFAHVIAALLSLFEGRPVTTNAALIDDIQENEAGIERYVRVTDATFLRFFVDCLLRLDRRLEERYGNLGILWMGREVSLTGFFGAVGKMCKDEPLAYIDKLNSLLGRIDSHPELLNLEAYERSRNTVELSKVNVGEINRRAIFNAIFDFATSAHPQPIIWTYYFGGIRDAEG